MELLQNVASMDLHTLELILAFNVGAFIGTLVMMINYGAFGRLFKGE